MKTYSVTMTIGSLLLASFAVYASTLKEAKQYAQTHKRLYILYDKPEGYPANRIKVTTRFASVCPGFDF